VTSTVIAAPASPALSDEEEAAIRSAAVWYFKRHARIIAEQADDPSAHAVARRDDFLRLHTALRKLGVPVALPDELRAPG
jgi:hypothetical protein